MLAVLMFNQMKSNTQNRLKTANPMSTSDSDGCCRTCLRNQNLMPLFSNKDIADKRTNDLLLVTGVQIKLNDGYSQKICTQCAHLLNTFYLFRQTCKKADRTLKNMGTKTKVKLKSTEKSKSVSKKLKDKKPIVTKVETDDYSYDYGDDYQDCDDYKEVKIMEYDEDGYEKKVMSEDVKPDLEELTAKPRLRRKRCNIPNAKSYKCSTCGKEFRMKATYKAHLRFHTSYCICEACGKLCRNNNQLQEHKRARHGLGKIHKCTYCEYSSATKEALTIHERRHTGERPYICDHCGASFHRRANLVQHIAIHLPERNFQCPICFKWEKSRKRLQGHIFKVHRERKYRYLCPLCPNVYGRRDHTTRHLQRVHKLTRDNHPPVTRQLIDKSQHV